MIKLPGHFSLHGREEPPQGMLRLRAGPLAMLFEPESAFVRRICLGEREVLRGIYMAVRDRNWGTVPACVESLKQDVQPNSFELSFTVNCRAGDIHFRWTGQLSGAADGTLRYVFEGEAGTTFLKNRIGFCVLHPLKECCGAPAWYERADGARGEVRFPTLIEPQIVGQSTFSNLRRLAHEIRLGCWAELEFQGDLFETEDQRNWTDASFKTYCTPLALPFPVEIKAGTPLRQAVTLRLGDGDHCGPAKVESTPARPARGMPAQATKGAFAMALTIPHEPTGLMPRLGLGAASHGMPLNAEEVSRLSVLQLNHLRVDLRLTELEWPQVLSRATTEAQQLGVALELALHLGADGSEPALLECGALLKRMRIPVARMLVLRQSEPASSAATLELARRRLGLRDIELGGGSDAHFCELNREQALGRFGLRAADFVSWPMTPQVHAFDDFSVLENLEAQPHTVATARTFAGNRPLVISPITLRPRFNAVATGQESSDSTQLPPQVDPRQLSLFTAAWTLGSIALLAAIKVASLTYFETTGWRGLMETTSPSARHPMFPSVPGMVFPVYLVFAALAGYSRMAPVAQEHQGPKTIGSLCLFDTQGRRRLVCANLTASASLVALDLGAERASVRTLNIASGDCSSEHAGPTWSLPALLGCPGGILRLALPPYAIGSLDSPL